MLFTRLRAREISHRDILFFLWRNSPQWARASSFTRFLDHTQRRITVGRTPLDEWLARRRDLYLTTHNTRNRQTSMPPMGFEHTISAGERPQTYALNRAATGIGTSTIASFMLRQLRTLYATRKHARNEKSVNGFCYNIRRREIAWRPTHIKEDALREKEARLS